MIIIREAKIYNGGYICLLSKTVPWTEIEKSRMLGCIEITKGNNAENNIMVCKTGIHPSCDHGIQFWSKNLEEISVEMAGRWTAKIIKGKEKLVYEQR